MIEFSFLPWEPRVYRTGRSLRRALRKTGLRTEHAASRKLRKSSRSSFAALNMTKLLHSRNTPPQPQLRSRVRKIAQTCYVFRGAVPQPAVQLRGFFQLLAAAARHHHVLGRDLR